MKHAMLFVLLTLATLAHAQLITGYKVGQTSIEDIGILPERTGTVHVQGHADGCCGSEVENYLTAWIRANKVAETLASLGYRVISDAPVVDGQRAVTWYVEAEKPLDTSELSRRIDENEIALRSAIQSHNRTTSALIGKITTLEEELAQARIRHWYGVGAIAVHVAEKARYFIGGGIRYKWESPLSITALAFIGGSYQSGYGAMLTPEYDLEPVRLFAGAMWRGKKNRATLRSDHWIGPLAGVSYPLPGDLSVSVAYQFEKSLSTALEVEKYSLSDAAHILTGNIRWEF